MNTTTLFVFMSGCLFCCSTNKAKAVRERTPVRCTQAEAVVIADSALKELHYGIETLDREITETDKSFVVQYLPKDTSIRGGGLQFEVSKEECKVIDVKRYQ